MVSACVPKLNTLAGNLILAEGCDRFGNDHWLRLFREDGTPVLRSLVHWREFSPLDAGNTRAGILGLATYEGSNGYVRGSAFHATDLSHGTVRLHQITDGRELFTTRLHNPLPIHQPIAFSPAGDRLAVLDGDNLSIYRITPSAAQAEAASKPKP